MQNKEEGPDKLISLCKAFDKNAAGSIRCDLFFLLAMRVSLNIPLERKAKLMQNFSTGNNIAYIQAIKWLYENLDKFNSVESKVSTVRPMTAIKITTKKQNEAKKHLNRFNVLASQSTQDNTDGEKLKTAQELMHLLKRRRLRSEKREEINDNFNNIITNKSVNYFDLQNYKHNRTFKQINDTIKNQIMRNITPLSTQNNHYHYSGMQHHQFLKYEDEMTNKADQLYYTQLMFIDCK